MKIKATGILQDLQLLGVLSQRADIKITTEIEKRLQDSINRSKEIINKNKDTFKDGDKNKFFDLFRIYSEQDAVLSLAISL